MSTRKSVVACLTSALYLVVHLPCALCQAHLTYTFPCDNATYIAAQTNQVPTNDMSREYWACHFILACADAKGRMIEGTQLTLSKEVHILSFSCGPAAAKIQIQIS